MCVCRGRKRKWPPCRTACGGPSSADVHPELDRSALASLSFFVKPTVPHAQHGWYYRAFVPTADVETASSGQQFFHRRRRHFSPLIDPPSVYSVGPLATVAQLMCRTWWEPLSLPDAVLRCHFFSIGGGGFRCLWCGTCLSCPCGQSRRWFRIVFSTGALVSSFRFFRSTSVDLSPDASTPQKCNQSPDAWLAFSWPLTWD